MNRIRYSRLSGALFLSACVALALGAAHPRPAAPTSKIKAAKTASKTATPPKKVPVKVAEIAPLPKTILGPPPKELPADPATKDADLVIDYSSDWQGYLEPCG